MNISNKINKLKMQINYITNLKYIIIAVLTAIVNYKIFNRIFYIDVVSGWDGTNHFAMAKYYADNIFPQTFGWVTAWHAGMIWPLGYPPLFHILFGVLSKIFPIDQMVLFKLVFVILTISFPLLIMLIAKNFYKDNMSLYFVGFLAIFYLISPFALFGALGVTVEATFKSGLYMQFFASYIMLIWLIFFLKSNSWNSQLISTIFLALVLLSNIHTGQAALVIIGTFLLLELILQRNIKLFIYKMFLIVISFGLISFWSFPLIENLVYFPSQTFHPLSFNQYIASIAFILTNTINLYFVFKNKQYVAFKLIISSYIIFLLAILPIYKIFPNLPLQPGRLLMYSVLIGIIMIPLLVKNVIEYYKVNSIHLKWFYLLIAIPFVINSSFPKFESYQLVFTDSEKGIIDFLQEKDNGRSLIEVHQPAYPSHFNIAALSGSHTHATLWNVFRESSMTATFSAPLRNSFSDEVEAFGISCMLCGGDDARDMKRSTLDILVQRADLFDVRYLVLRNNSLRVTELINSQLYLPSYELDDWIILERNNENMLIGNNAIPIQIYTPLVSKNRHYDGAKSYNWLRFSEQWFLEGDFTKVLIKSNLKNVEEIVDYQYFPVTIFTELRFQNFEKVKESIEKYTQDNLAIFLLEKSEIDKLISILSDTDFENIRILEKSNDFKTDYRHINIEILDFINKNNPEPSVNFELSMRNENFINKNLVKGQFYYIPSSYSPYWIDKNENELFMASPSLTVVYLSNDLIELEFTKSKIYTSGVIVSILNILLLILLIVIYNRKKLNRLL
jgi:hypothetical protein